MTAAAILAWAEVGAKLITILAVPVSTVVALFKQQGGTDAEAQALIGHWASLVSDIEARIALLEAQGAGKPPEPR